MNILQSIYDNTLPKVNFLERKVSIEEPYTIVIGPPKSGKTYLIYDYLSRFESTEYLYIDFSDYRNKKDDIAYELDYFIQENNIKIVVFENFEFDLDLPKVTNLIITTQELYENYPENFSTLYVPCLDFEEFLLFDMKHNSVSNSFNSFLKYGSFPEILEISESKKLNRNLEICKLYTQDTTKLQILFICIKFAAEKKSVFQLFNTLKKEIKISKDKFYKVFEEFLQNKIIFQCPKFDQEKAVKKIYIFNHALLDIVSYKKNFNNLFKNIVFLELQRRYEGIYYLDNVDFYLPKDDHILLAIPFFNGLLSSSVVSKILPIIQQYNIQTVTIVTISTEQTFFIEELEATVLPFYNWVLTL
jgi:predicted AAA+ superfamily ATPase